MFFAQTIRDLFSKINHTNEAVSRIDKETGIVANSQGILIKDFQRLKDDFKKHVDDPQGCSSQKDISFLLNDKLEQNGKIIKLTVATTRQGHSIDELTETTKGQTRKIGKLATEISTLTMAVSDIKNKRKWKDEWRSDLIKLILMIITMGGFLITYDKWRASKTQTTTIAVQPPENTQP